MDQMVSTSVIKLISFLKDSVKETMVRLGFVATLKGR